MWCTSISSAKLSAKVSHGQKINQLACRPLSIYTYLIAYSSQMANPSISSMRKTKASQLFSAWHLKSFGMSFVVANHKAYLEGKTC